MRPERVFRPAVRQSIKVAANLGDYARRPRASIYAQVADDQFAGQDLRGQLSHVLRLLADAVEHRGDLLGRHLRISVVGISNSTVMRPVDVGNFVGGAATIGRPR